MSVPRVEPTEAGDYKLCFDNSFSTISEKLVFFELIFDSLQDEEEVEGWAEAVEPEEILDVKMEDIKVRPGELGPLLPDLWHCSLPSPWLGSAWAWPAFPTYWCLHAKLLHSYHIQLFCDPVDCSPPGSSVHWTLQAKILSGLLCPSPGDLPNPGTEPTSLMSPALAGRFFTTSLTWEAPYILVPPA